MASLSAREQAYQTIRSRIITMDLKPGDDLNDRELAEELGHQPHPHAGGPHHAQYRPHGGHQAAKRYPCGSHRPEADGAGAVCPLYSWKKRTLNRPAERYRHDRPAGARLLEDNQYRQVIENYRLLEARPDPRSRPPTAGDPRLMLELDNQHSTAAPLRSCGMEHHFDHMLGQLQHVERIRKFSLQTSLSLIIPGTAHLPPYAAAAP